MMKLGKCISAVLITVHFLRLFPVARRKVRRRKPEEVDKAVESRTADRKAGDAIQDAAKATRNNRPPQSVGFRSRFSRLIDWSFAADNFSWPFAT
jgi:hypothetical protein